MQDKTQNLVDYIVDNVNIVDLIGKFTKVNVSGNSAKCLCPIHRENTPSLSITISKKLYICFGCKSAGNVINFVQDYFKYNFAQAVEWLSAEYKLDIKPFKSSGNSFKKHIDCNTAISNILIKTDYFASRGVSQDIVNKFMLGKSVSVTNLYTIDCDKNALSQSIDNANMWNNTYIYPLIDHTNNIYGFKSRKADNVREWGMTSNQNPLFSSNKYVPYGFHIARSEAKNKPLIIVEGNHDVLKMHTHGFSNCVGLNSSSFSEGHVSYLEGFKIKDIIFMLDNDNAGISSMLKIAAEHMYSKFNTKFVKIHTCKDPDEFLDKLGCKSMATLIENAMSAQEFIITSELGNPSWSTINTDIHNKIQKLGNVINHDDIIALSYLSKYVDIKLAEALLYTGNPNTNIEYEEIIIKHLVNADSLNVVNMLLELKIEHFISPYCKEAFTIIKALSENEYSKDKFISEINSEKLFHLNKFLSPAYGILFETMKQKFVDSATKYNMSKYLRNASDKIYKSNENISKIVSTLYDHINSMINVSNSTQDASTVVDQVLSDIFKKAGGEDNSINIGDQFTRINACLKGITPGNLITIAANQSVGKTTLLCNWLHAIIRSGRSWLHFSLEMSNGQILSKIIGIDANVESEKMQSGTLSAENTDKVMDSAKFFYKSGLLLNDECNDINDIINIAMRYMKSHKIAGISIDYIQLIRNSNSRGKKRYEELGEISGDLKNFARKHNMPVIILSQLSKEALKADVAKAEHGSESYKIAQDSDQYITLKPMDDDIMNIGGQTAGNLVFNIDKNRFGKTGLFTVYFNKDYQKMHEIGV